MTAPLPLPIVQSLSDQVGAVLRTIAAPAYNYTIADVRDVEVGAEQTAGFPAAVYGFPRVSNLRSKGAAGRFEESVRLTIRGFVQADANRDALTAARQFDQDVYRAMMQAQNIETIRAGVLASTGAAVLGIFNGDVEFYGVMPTKNDQAAFDHSFVIEYRHDIETT